MGDRLQITSPELIQYEIRCPKGRNIVEHRRQIHEYALVIQRNIELEAVRKAMGTMRFSLQTAACSWS